MSDSYKLYEFSNNLGYIDEKMPDDVYKILLEEIDVAFGIIISLFCCWRV